MKTIPNEDVSELSDQSSVERPHSQRPNILADRNHKLKELLDRQSSKNEILQDENESMRMQQNALINLLQGKDSELSAMRVSQD